MKKKKEQRAELTLVLGHSVVELGDFDGEIRPDNLIHPPERLNDELHSQMSRVDQSIHLQETVHCRTILNIHSKKAQGVGISLNICNEQYRWKRSI